MVLTHTSGFPNWRGQRELGFLFDPGERFGYSGEGFGLLQQVVQEITGEGLDALVRTLTFEPLGMTHSTYVPGQVDLDNYAWPHDGAGNAEPRPENLEDRRRRARGHAAASLVTTAGDYARFLIALARGTGLEPATHEAMLEPYVETDEGNGVWWGLGTGLEKTAEGIGAWHWGDNNNSKAFYLIDPASGDGIVYFANAFNGLGIVGDMLEITMPGDHPLLAGALLDSYPALDSPEFLFATAVYTEGADRAVALVREQQKSSPMPPEAEGLINRMGYWLMGQDRLDEAITLFELNVELFPEAWNVYDSLGEAQLAKGLREEGLANYRRSLEINPENQGARTILTEAGVSLD
jgi:CubicO group peptidase (beta-lactamase class C family)